MEMLSIGIMIGATTMYLIAGMLYRYEKMVIEQNEVDPNELSINQ